ncbi:MAG: type II CAAX prenyl endopeptidase Rce1 family protein [Acidobacteriota bacterium]
MNHSVLLPIQIPARSRRRELAEIFIAYALILMVIWTPRPWQRYLWLVAVAGVAAILASSWPGAQALGLRARNFFRSLWVVGAALLCAAIAVVVSHRLHALHDPGGPLRFLASYGAYIVWAGVQQFLLQCFFLSRLLRVIPNPRYAAFAAAGLFALAHVPNPILVGLTVVWGSFACLIFLRYRNLFPLAIAHAILGVTVAIAVPGPVDHNMRVGLGYLKYRHGFRKPRPQRSHIDQSVSTVAWVTADAPTRRSRLQARP